MKRPGSSLIAQLGAIAGVIIVMAVADRISDLSLLRTAFPSHQSSPFLVLFEKHMWLFCVGFAAILWLSRGHLWSYGINSHHLKISMKYLLWVYGITIAATVIDRAAGFHSFLPVPETEFPLGMRKNVMAMLVFWMSAPVADTILIYGFGQTVLTKYAERTVLRSVPVSVIASAILFVVFSSAARVSGVGVIAVIPTLCLGAYNGFVYWKTGSLIMPMLGQAFFFGFPLVVKILIPFPS